MLGAVLHEYGTQVDRSSVRKLTHVWLIGHTCPENASQSTSSLFAQNRLVK